MAKKNGLKHVIISGILLFLAFGLVKSSYEVWRGGKRLDDLEQEIKGLQAKKAALEEEIRYKQTGEFIEEKARNDLNLVKPGDSVFVVSGSGLVEEAVKGKSGSGVVMSGKSVRTGLEEEANWYLWYKLFF
jgi:cell division protein FtsB